MNKLILSFLSIVAVCHLSMAEEVSSNPGFYGDIFGGAAVFQDGEVNVITTASQAEREFEIDTGYSTGLRLGYDFGSFRVEGEYTYAAGDISSLEASPNSVSVSSEYTSHSLMLNGLIDYDLSPFLISAGVGLGASNVEYGKMSVSGLTAVDDVDGSVFSYQGILRASYQVSERALIGFSYRYVVNEGLDDSGSIDTSTTTTVSSDFKYKEVGISLFEIFFSYDF